MKYRKHIEIFLKYYLIAGLICIGCSNMMAQRMIRVSGTVYNAAETRKKTPVTDAEVIVYSCKTIGEGEKFKKELDADNLEVAVFVDPETVTKIDHNGYYEILVPDNGALIFKAEMTKAVMINVRREVSVSCAFELLAVLCFGNLRAMSKLIASNSQLLMQFIQSTQRL